MPTSNPSVDGPAENDELNALIAQVWERSRQATANRLAIQDEAAVAQVAGLLDDHTRRSAQDAAHKLAGGLGTFGLHLASRLAAQLERHWGTTEPLSPREVAQVVVHLRHEIGEGPPALQRTGPVVETDSAAPDSSAALPAFVDILIVEDEVVAGFVVPLLQSRGYSVHWLSDGDTAITALSEDLACRLLLLDVNLPGRSSLEDVQSAKALGVTDYVARPLDPPLLIERVERALPT